MSSQTLDPTNRTVGEKTLNRRRVLKAAIATAPIIATLPTGAALARSSNVISSTMPASATDSQRRTLCLNADSGSMVSNGTAMDLGVPPSGSVTAIRQRDYRVDDRLDAARISESAMCKRGGSFYYQRWGWHKVDVPRGMLVSATALSSFAGSIHFTEV